MVGNRMIISYTAAGTILLETTMRSRALILRSLLALGAALLLQFAVLLGLLAHTTQEQTRTEMEHRAAALAAAASPALLGHDLVGLQVLGLSFFHPPLSRLSVSDPRGETLTLAGHDEHAQRHLQQAIIEQGQLLGYVHLDWNDISGDQLAGACLSSLALLAVIDIGLLGFALLALTRHPRPSAPTTAASAPDSDLSRVHLRIDDLHPAMSAAQSLEDFLVHLAEESGSVFSGNAQQGYAFEFSLENRVERQWQALRICITALTLAPAQAGLILKAGLAHGRQSARGELSERSQRLSHSAPSGHALLDEQDMLPLLAQRAVITQKVRMELGSDMGVHKILCVQRLQPEYQSLLDRRIDKQAD